MINFLFSITGFLVLLWYTCIKWTYCSKETWLYTPINALTSLCAIWFILATMFLMRKTFNDTYYLISVFLLIRNVYYTIEDGIDFRHFPSFRQGVYVYVDVIMAVFVLLWQLKFAGVK